MMQEILDELWQMRSDCERLATQLSEQYRVSQHVAPVVALTMCYNWVTMTLELVSFYKQEWGARAPTNSTEMEGRQERIVECTKALFIFSLSSVEYVLKEAAKAHPRVLELNFGTRQYLPGIMGKSHGVGLIDIEAKLRWDGLAKFRNCLVHNNGNADENLTVNFPNGLTIAMHDGYMTAATTGFFTHLTHWLIGAYAEWCDAFLKRAN
jgi:hypothetical protein